MRPLPSEHIYLPLPAIPVMRAGLKKLSNRLADAKLGRFHHERPTAIMPLGSPEVYVDRRFDDELAMQIHKLKHCVGRIGKHGKVRLNLTAATLLAFAIRCAREVPVTPDFDLHEFELKIENLRRRLVRATSRRFGNDHYDEFRSRWRKFSKWMRYKILCDRPPRGWLRSPGVGRLKREQRLELRSWIRRLTSERCEQPLPETRVAYLASLLGRSVKRTHFAGATLREMLKDQKKYDDIIFEFIKKREKLDLKREYLDASRLWSSRFKDRSFVTGVSVDKVPAPPLPDRASYSENELIEKVASFLQEHVEYSSWLPIAKQLPVNLPSESLPDARTVEEMIPLARPTWEPAYGYQERDWEAQWIQRWLIPFTDRSRLQSIVMSAVSLLRKKDRALGPQVFVS